MLRGKILTSLLRLTHAGLGLFALLLVQCSTVSGLSTATESVEDYGTSDLGDNIIALNFSSTISTIDVNDLAGDEDVVLVLYAKSESGDSSVGIELSASLPSSLNGATLRTTLADASESEDSAGDGDVTEALHEQLRALEADLQNLPMRQNHSFQASLSESDADVSVGHEVTFAVLSSFTDYEEYTDVTATLVYQTESFNYYLDNDALDSMSDDHIAELCDNFEGVIADMRDFYGDESDVNGDGRFDILSTPVVNGLGGSPGSVVTGFWFARDLYDLENSNQREIFYTAVADPSGSYGARISENFAVSNILRGVFPHEFQHMINYNEKVNVAGGSSEETWLNEALSHLAEDIFDQDDDRYMRQSGNENPARIASYLDNISETCFTCGSNLRQRGGSYLFLRYLYEQAHGEGEQVELLNSLVQSPLAGIENITATLGGTSDDFYDMMGQFAVAIFRDGTDSADAVFSFDGIDLRATQDDNRNTPLNGPELIRIDDLSYIDSLSGTSLMYLYIPAATLQDNGGQFTISYSGDAELAGYLITG